MTKDKILEAKFEAERFLVKADNMLLVKPDLYWCYPKESGALRRSSMDLTRALAEMRKP